MCLHLDNKKPHINISHPSLRPKMLCIDMYCIHICIIMYIYIRYIEGIVLTYIYIEIYRYRRICTHSQMYQYPAQRIFVPPSGLSEQLRCFRQATCRSMAHKLSERAPAIQVRADCGLPGLKIISPVGWGNKLPTLGDISIYIPQIRRFTNFCLPGTPLRVSG